MKIKKLTLNHVSFLVLVSLVLSLGCSAYAQGNSCLSPQLQTQKAVFQDIFYQNNFPDLSSSLKVTDLEEVELLLYKQEKIAFLEKMISHGEEEPVLILRKYIYNNDLLADAWFNPETTLEKRLQMITSDYHAQRLEAQETDIRSAEKAAVHIHFSDRYNLKSAKLIEKTSAQMPSVININSHARITLLDEEKEKHLGIKLFVQIDRVLEEHPDFAGALKLVGQYKQIYFGLAKQVSYKDEYTTAITLPSDKSKGIFIGLFSDDGKLIDYQSESIENSYIKLKGQLFSLLERTLAHEVAHLFVDNGNGIPKRFILAISNKQEEKINSFILKYLEHKKLDTQNTRILVYDALKSLYLQRRETIDQNIADLDENTTVEELEELLWTKFISLRAYGKGNGTIMYTPDEFWAEYLSVFWLDQEYMKETDEQMYGFITAIADWKKLLTLSYPESRYPMTEAVREKIDDFFYTSYDQLSDMILAEYFTQKSAFNIVVEELFLLADFLFYDEIVLLSDDWQQMEDVVQKYFDDQLSLLQKHYRLGRIKKSGFEKIKQTIDFKLKEFSDLKKHILSGRFKQEIDEKIIKLKTIRKTKDITSDNLRLINAAI